MDNSETQATLRIKHRTKTNNTKTRHKMMSNTVIKAVIIWQLDLQLPMQSVPIATVVVNSHLDQGEVYNIM